MEKSGGVRLKGERTHFFGSNLCRGTGVRYTHTRSTVGFFSFFSFFSPYIYIYTYILCIINARARCHGDRVSSENERKKFAFLPPPARRYHPAAADPRSLTPTTRTVYVYGIIELLINKRRATTRSVRVGGGGGGGGVTGEWWDVPP